MKKILVVITVIFVFEKYAGAGDYQLYFLGGQSNMVGYGVVKELPAELNTVFPGVMIFHGNQAPDGAAVDGRGIWSELRPGHGGDFASDGKLNSYSDRFGLELTFSRTLMEQSPGSQIALIKYSRDGTAIDTAAAGEFGCWDPDYRQGNGVNQYDHFLATIRNALSVKDINGDGEADRLVPAGILWMQGEADASFTAETAGRYRHNLKRLMDLIRAAFRNDDLPVVIGRISDSGQHESGKVWEFGELVRQAQSDFVIQDGQAALVSNTDGYGYSDPWHYDSAGYIDLGKRFAEAMISQLKMH